MTNGVPTLPQRLDLMILRGELSQIKALVEKRILSTPTGEVRNVYCDINIGLTESLEKIQQLL